MKPHALTLDAHADYGPSVTRSRDGRLTSTGPASVVLEDRPDPDAPKRTVRGARRYDGLLDLLRTGRIREPEYAAAELLRRHCAIAGGARVVAAQSGIRIAFNSASYSLSDAQVDAQGYVRAAWPVIGQAAAGVVSWTVLGNGSLRDYAAVRRTDREKVTQVLAAALGRLVKHYEVAFGEITP